MASKTKHAERWIALRASGVPINCTWIDEAGTGETNDWQDLWDRCIGEASNAAALIAYRETGETVKGAFVEIGAALACGVPVYWVGPTDGAGTVFRHRNVQIVNTLEEAVAAAMEW